MVLTQEQRAALTTIKPPEDVVAELSAMVSEALPITKIKELFYETLKEEYLDGFTDMTDRCRNASKVVLASLASKAGQTPEPFEIKIFDKTGIKVFDKKGTTEKNHLAQVFGIGAPAKPDMPPKFTTIMLWGQAAQLIDKFVEGDAIKFSGLIRTTDSEYSVALFDGHVPGFATEKITVNLPSPIEIIRKGYPELAISQVAQNVSVKGETRLVRGRVASGRVALSKKNNNTGHLNLINPASTLKEITEKAPGTGFHITFTDEPAMATRYETGSDVLVLCVITNDPQYGLSGLGKLIVPIFAIPKKVAPSAPPASPASPASQPGQQTLGDTPAGTKNLVNW